MSNITISAGLEIHLDFKFIFLYQMNILTDKISLIFAAQEPRSTLPAAKFRETFRSHRNLLAVSLHKIKRMTSQEDIKGIITHETINCNS